MSRPTIPDDGESPRTLRHRAAAQLTTQPSSDYLFSHLYPEVIEEKVIALLFNNTCAAFVPLGVDGSPYCDGAELGPQCRQRLRQVHTLDPGRLAGIQR